MIVSRTVRAICALTTGIAIGLCTTGHALAQQEDVTGVVVTIAEQPEGLIPSQNWADTRSLLVAQINRPESEDAEVIAEIRQMGEEAHPALLMVMAIRLAETAPDEAAYLFQKGAVLSRLSLASCQDVSASGGLQFVMTTVARAMQRRKSPLLTPAMQLQGYEAVLADNGIPGLTVSPWWMCSNGLQALGWDKQSNRPMPLSEWYVGDAAVQRNRERLTAEIAAFVASETANEEADSALAVR